VSFGSTQRIPAERGEATLGQALVRPCLLCPLASLRVSGQWPVFAW